MVNFGLNSASILGIFLAVAGAGLYFLRSVRPEVSRDYDIFFSAVGLLCGLILLFQGWRLDPILQFGQLLLAGSTIFFAAETIRLRGITTEQARRSTPYADDRRVSKTRVYTEAELDQIEPFAEEEPVRNNRRLRGYDDKESPTRPDPYAENEARPSRPRSGRARRPSSNNNRPSRRPQTNRPTRDPYAQEDYPSWEEPGGDMWDDAPQSRRRSSNPSKSRRPQRPSRETESTSRRRPTSRPERPSSRSTQPYNDEPPAAYVDYQPIEDSESTSPSDSYPNRPPERRSPRPKRPPESTDPDIADLDSNYFDY